MSGDPRAWYHDAKHVDGSWWTQWLGWIQERSGAQHETQMTLGNANYPPWTQLPAPMFACAESLTPRPGDWPWHDLIIKKTG